MSEPLTEDELVEIEAMVGCVADQFWNLVDTPDAWEVYLTTTAGEEPTVAVISKRWPRELASFIARSCAGTQRLIATIRARENAYNIAMSDLRMRDDRIAALTAERDDARRLLIAAKEDHSATLREAIEREQSRCRVCCASPCQCFD